MPTGADASVRLRCRRRCALERLGVTDPGNLSDADRTTVAVFARREKRKFLHPVGKKFIHSSMRFRHHDQLRLFVDVARYDSFSAAADALHLSKGAVGYQMSNLEDSLGVKLFVRHRKGIRLTSTGSRLARAAASAYEPLEGVVESLSSRKSPRVTVGMSTYFASRWLSPRLMHFLQRHPGVSLRLQPLVDLLDTQGHDLDIAIRWGDGDWSDAPSECLFACEAFATAAPRIAEMVEREGLEAVLRREPLLKDREDSVAWEHWLAAAGFGALADISTQSELVIPDPNVRVQAAIDGQGLALNDALVTSELSSGSLVRVSEAGLADYGYHLVFSDGALKQPGVELFHEWILRQVNASAQNA